MLLWSIDYSFGAMQSVPYIIGLVGGIGSGKSVVSRLLRIMDVPVYDCDSEAKRLMHENATIRKLLVETIGTGVYDAIGRLDRAYLASYMFGDEERVALVNSIVHPVVRSDFKEWTRRMGKPIVAVESAILFEAGMEDDVDVVWLIHASEEVRLLRAVKRDKTSEDAIRSRMQCQMSEQEYMERVDAVVYNGGNRSLIAQVKGLLDEISDK